MVGGLKRVRGAGMVAWRVEWFVLVVWRGRLFQLMWVMWDEVKTSSGVVVLASPWREMVVFARVAERMREGPMMRAEWWC